MNWQWRKTACAVLLGAVAHGNRDVSAITLPSGFTEFPVVSGLVNPTAMAFAPDGRLFVCQQGGALRVISNGTLLATPFVSVSVNQDGERGLLGIAFDPDFANNHYLYVYYTPTTPNLHRVSRFTANGNVAVPGSEAVIFTIPDASGATNHNGGALRFSRDGKLLIAVGERAQPSNAQTLSNLLGKVLRINSDGSIPTDNPFYNTATGNNRAIWVLGLRNPFTMDVHPTSGDVFINDVGGGSFEEVNHGVAGSNYGWPIYEGEGFDPQYRSPLYAYSHGEGCAITGAAFYVPAQINFPPSYNGRYFFSDLCSNFIRVLDPVNGNSVSTFATETSSNPVGLAVGPDGGLYYLARAGVVRRISYTAGVVPVITTPPASQTAAIDDSVTFSVTASGTPPLGYQWQRNGVDIPGATATTYSIASATLADSGARFRCRVSNNFGSVNSAEAVLTVVNNHRPQATIVTPSSGSLYSGGDTIAFSGSATDAEDGTLGGVSFTWTVVFHHDTHTHPHMPPVSGSTSGSFSIPTLGETATNVWYRIYLTVTDSGGLARQVYRDVLPRITAVTLATNPAGLTVSVDGQAAQTAPRTWNGVVGMTRSVGTAPAQFAGGAAWQFLSWSDGGTATHDITVPGSPVTMTATFGPEPTPSAIGVAWTHLTLASAAGGTLTKTGGSAAYDSGAISAKQILSGPCFVEFTTPGLGYMAVGLAVGDSSQHYNDIDFAVFVRSNGTFNIMERGNVLTAGGSYAAGDRFRVEVSGGGVRYRRNGTLVYSSLLAPVYPLVADTALYSPGVQVGTATMGAFSLTQQPPVADAGGTYAAAPGELITFDGTASNDPDGTIVSYSWTFGDGASGTGASAPHAYASLGTYTAVLTVTDGDGLTDTDSRTVTIGPAPPPVAVVWTNRVMSSASGGTLTKTGMASAYDAGAISAKQVLGGTAFVEFTATGMGYLAAGLGMGNSSQHYDDIDFAVFLRATGTFSVMERGAVRPAGGSYSAGDRFRVEIADGAVRYRRNGTIVYTSGLAPVYPLVVDTALYTPGAQVGSALMGGFSLTQDPPVAHAGGSYSAAPAEVVTFDGTGSSDTDGTIVSYAWTFGDGSSGSGASPAHAYAAAGNYTATLTVTDTDGLTDTDSRTVAVAVAPTTVAVVWTNRVMASASGGTLTKTGTSAAYDAGAVSAKQIPSGDGFAEFTATGMGFMAVGLGVGDTSQHYTDIDFAVFLRSSGTFNVMERGAVLSAGGGYAAGDRFRVEIVGGVVRYRRNGGLVHTSALAPVYPLVVDTALYSPGVQVGTAIMGGFAMTQQPPTADAGGPYTSVPGDSLTFSGTASIDPDGVIVSYAWSFGDGSSATGATAAHAYASAGTYTATLTVTDSDGLTDTDSRTVTINTPPTPAAVVWTSLVAASASGGTLTKTGSNSAYDSGATSSASIPSGDGYIEFTAHGLGFMAVGLGVGNSSQHYSDIDFAFFLRADGSYAIMERGNVLGVGGGTYAPGQRFRVEILGGLVRYRRNGAVVHTSALAPVYPLVVDTALYTPGVQVENAQIAR